MVGSGGWLDFKMNKEKIQLLNKIRNKYVEIQQKTSRLDFITDEFIDWIDEVISEVYLKD